MPSGRFLNVGIVVALLVLATTLAFTSLIGDSITFDEMSHLTSGFSYLKTGDFRLAPDHPPLAKMWAAAPLLLLKAAWQPDRLLWEESNVWEVGHDWFYNINNGEYLLIWHPPGGIAEALGPGSRGAGVLWLRESLAAIDARYATAAADSDIFDRDLADTVRAFQRDHRLDIDGIAGHQTQIIINTRLDPGNTPRLTAQPRGQE